MTSIEIVPGFNKLENKKVEEPTIILETPFTTEEPKEPINIVPTVPIEVVPGFNRLQEPAIKGEIGTNTLIGQADDLTTQLVQNEQDKRVADSLDFLKTLKQDSTEVKKLGVPENEEDPWGIRVLSDVYTGATESITAINAGVQEGVVQGITAMDELAVWLNNNITFGKTIDEGLNNFYQSIGIDVKPGPSEQGFQPLQARTADEIAQEVTGNIVFDPKLRQKQLESFTGNAIKSISQFLVGFIPVFRGAKLVTGGTSVAKNSPWLVGAANSIFASSSAGVVFDPAEDRLSNLLKDLEAFPEFSQPIFEYLATDPNDSRAEGRFKTAIESMGLTAVGEGLFKALTTLKHVRNLSGKTTGLSGSADVPEGAIPSLQDVTTTRTVPEGIQPNSKEFWFNEAKKNEEAINNLTKQLDELGGPPLKEQTPKITLKDGTVLTGKPGQGHANILSDYNLNDKDIQGAKAGWVNEASAETKAKVNELYTKLQDAQEFAPVYQNKIAKAKTSAEIAESKAIVSTKSQTFSAQGKKETHAKIEKRVGPAQQGAIRSQGFLTKEGKFITPDEAKKLAQAELAAGPKFRFSGRPGQAFGDEVAEQAFLSGKGSLAKVVDSLDTGVLANTSHINEAISRLTKLAQFSFKKGDTTDLKVLEKLSRRLGIDIQNLAIKQPDLAANPAKVQAYHYMLDASDNNLRQAAKEIVEKADVANSESALAEFVRRLNIRQAINEQLRNGQMSKNINNIFDNVKPLSGTISEQISKARAVLQKFGGANKVRSMAEAINNSKDINKLAKALDPNSMKVIGDAFTSYWYWSLLSGLGTHALNFASTGMNLIWQIPARSLAAQFNKILGSADGVVVGEATQMMYGFITSLKDAISSAWKVYKTGEGIIDKFEHSIPKDAISSAKLGGGPVFGPIVDLAGKAFNYTAHNILLGTDEFYRVLATNMQSRALALRQAVGEGLEGRALAKRINELVASPSELQKLDIDDFVNEVLFTKQLGAKGRKLQELLNMVPGSKLVVPFVRTPTNLVKQSIRNSPLGLLSKSMWQDIAAGNARGQVQLAKTLMGTGIVTIVVEEAINGRITGYGPRDPQLRANWLLTHKPFSIWLGEKHGWVTYNRLDPFGMMIATSASVAEAFGDLSPETYGELIGMLGTAVAQSVINKTWATGPAGFMEALTDPEGFKAEAWIKRQMGTILVPNIMAQSVKLHDPLWRETYSGPDDPVWQDIWNQMKSRTISFSETLPAKRNIWGQPIWTMSLGPDIISPLYQTIPDGKPINEWLWVNRVEIGMPSHTRFSSYTGGEGVELNPFQYERFVVLAGNELKHPQTGMGLYDALNAIIEGKHPLSNSWVFGTDGPNGTRAIMIKDMIADYRALAENQLYFEDKALQHKISKTRNKVEFNLTIGPGEPGGQ